MKPRLLVLAALLAITACKKAEEKVIDLVPTRETIGDTAMIDFESPKAAFICRAPRDWGIREERYLDSSKGASFIGPDGAITILKYPESEPRYTDALKYAETFWEIDPDNKQPEITREKIGDVTVIRFHQERASQIPHTRKMTPPYRYDYALFPIKGGFFEIQHRAPASSYKTSLPVFEAVVRSFKPKS